MAVLRRRCARVDAARMPVVPPEGVEHPLCSACVTWLADIVSLARNAEHEQSLLLAVPSHGDRQVIFGGQCHAFRDLLTGDAATVDLDGRLRGVAALPLLLPYPACETGFRVFFTDDARLKPCSYKNTAATDWVLPDWQIRDFPECAAASSA
jgi:hypothetical protein